VKTQLDKAIGSKLSSDNTLCTDAWRVFSTYAKSKGMEYYRFKSDGTERVKGLYHEIFLKSFLFVKEYINNIN
jgi:hypothetical protein